jgi:hypothetical protein
MSPLLLCLACLAQICASAQETPRPAGDSPVEIVESSARWTNLPGVDELGGDGTSFYVISGTLRNAGTRSVGHVKLRFDLIDADGVVVASEYGYNRLAEDLRLPDYEEGKIPRVELHITPLAAGESDTFRMMFLRGAVPSFATWRVRVLGVGE